MISLEECPICHGTAFSPFLTCTDHSVSHETFSMVRCLNCHLVLTNPRPDDTEIEKYYLSQAYTSHINRATSFFDKLYILARTFTLQWKLALIQKYHAEKSGNLLDLGCGVGEFLKVCAKNEWQVTGVEPSSVARANADPIVSKNIVPSLADIANQPKTFDAITAWHVLEHVSELHKTVQILEQLLQPNGTIFIAVPNHNSWDARHYGKYWAAYDVPRHLWHFTTDSMTRLLSAHSLSVRAILPMRLDAYYVSLLSEKYKGNSTIPRLANTVLKGFRSNYFAGKNREYSSLIYIVQR